MNTLCVIVREGLRNIGRMLGRWRGMLNNRSVKTVTCNNCKTEYEAKPNEPPEGRTRCPICGCTARLAFQSLEARVAAHPTLRYKGRRGGRGKPFIEGVIGDDWFRKTQEWRRLERLIDHENYQYKEVIIDPATGAAIHCCEEPLRDHQGHGSAKTKANN